MTSAYTESERRLRAVVRAFLSPGVWLVVGVQFLMQLVLRQGVPAGEAGPDPLLTAALAALMMGFAYLQAGAYRGLAQGAERLTLREAATAGAALFVRFLWLFLKLGLVAALVFNLFALLLLTGADMRPEALLRQLVPYMPPLLAALGFVFAYWLPLVFVSGDFRLFATWRRALATAWQRLPQSGFLALILFLPVVLFALLPEATPATVLLPLSLIASLFGWIAYIYCAEWLRDHPPADASAAG